MIKVSEIVLHEADEPYVVADLLDADLLAGEDGAEVYFPAFVTDTATAGDDGRPVMERIVEFAQSRVGSGRTCIEVRWNVHVQSLMWPDIVKAVDEVIDQQTGLMNKMKKLQTKHQVAVKNVLSDEQVMKLDQRKRHSARMSQGRKGRGDGHRTGYRRGNGRGSGRGYRI